MKSAYFRFLSRARMASALPGAPVLDPVEERLLCRLATLWGNDYRPTVLETLGIDAGVSARTVQRRMEDLRTKGMIEYQFEPKDQRIKRVAPTKLAEQYFSHMDQLMHAASREKSA